MHRYIGRAGSSKQATHQDPMTSLKPGMESVQDGSPPASTPLKRRTGSAHSRGTNTHPRVSVTSTQASSHQEHAEPGTPRGDDAFSAVHESWQVESSPTSRASSVSIHSGQAEPGTPHTIETGHGTGLWPGTQPRPTSRARELWHATNIHAALSRGDDEMFLRGVRARTDWEGKVSNDRPLGQLQLALEGLEEMLYPPETPEAKLPDAILKELQRDVRALKRDLVAVQNGTSSGARMGKALLSLGNLWPVLVPSPLLAGEGKTFAGVTAAAMNGMLMLAGDARAATANGVPLLLPIPGGGGAWRDHAIETQLYSWVINGAYLCAEMARRYGSGDVPAHAASAEASVLVNGAIGAIGVTVLVGLFYGEQIQKATAAAKRSIIEAAANQGVISRERGDKHLAPPLAAATAEVKKHIKLFARDLAAGQRALEEAKAEFTDPTRLNHEISRMLHDQAERLVNGARALSSKINTAVGKDWSSEASFIDDKPGKIVRDNPDRDAKLALSLFFGGISAATVALVQPDKIGTVTLVADGLAVSSVLLHGAFSPEVDRRRQEDQFRNMCSTSLVLAMALLADKCAQSSGAFPDGLIESSEASPYLAAVMMTAMVMVLPGPMALASTKALTATGSALSSAASSARDLVGSAASYASRLFSGEMADPTERRGGTGVVISEPHSAGMYERTIEQVAEDRPDPRIAAGVGANDVPSPHSTLQPSVQLHPPLPTASPTLGRPAGAERPKPLTRVPSAESFLSGLTGTSVDSAHVSIDIAPVPDEGEPSGVGDDTPPSMSLTQRFSEKFVNAATLGIDTVYDYIAGYFGASTAAPTSPASPTSTPGLHATRHPQMAETSTSTGEVDQFLHALAEFSAGAESVAPGDATPRASQAQTQVDELLDNMKQFLDRADNAKPSGGT